MQVGDDRASIKRWTLARHWDEMNSRPEQHRGRRDLAILAAGSAISTAGDTAAYIALVLRVQSSGSGYVSALLAAEFLPTVALVAVSGMVVDRFDAKRVQVTCLLGQAVVAAALALTSNAFASIALMAMLGSFWAFTRPAFSALIPRVTGEEGAAKGYSSIAVGQSFGWIVGPAAGGLLAGHLGSGVTLGIDSLTFLVLAGSLLFVQASRPGARAGRADSAKREDGSAAAGIRLIWNDSYLRIALVLTAFAIGIAVLDNVAAPYRFVDQLHAGSSGYGIYLAVWAIGALVGARLIGRLNRTDRAAHQLALGNVVICLGIAGIGAAPTYWVALVASLIGGVGNGMADVAENVVIQSRTPEQLRGRAFAAAGALMQGAIAVGTIVAAPAVAFLGAGRAMLSFGLLAALTSACGLIYAMRRVQSPNARISTGGLR